LGEFEGAKHLLEKAMASDERNFGPEHPSTARSYSNLALVLQDLGEFEGARQLAERALKVFESALPAGHPHIAIVRNICASLSD
ncbi:MAG: tetratricopeptide repeat protein, partial [Cyanobacteria bacterium P01_F01_bin.33]